VLGGVAGLVVVSGAVLNALREAATRLNPK
jgi:hypothetical protein